MSLEGMITQAEKSIGLRTPNAIQQWYRERNGATFAYNFPWCNAAITYWATQAGERESVLFGTDYAYTVAHAQRFKTAGQWTAMTNGIARSGIRRGDIVFFDWAGTSSIAAIDHVGIITDVKGQYVYTIEGNTASVCARRVRTVGQIAGFGRPKYKAATPPAAGSGTYTVRDGDSLSEIAAAHKTSVAVLVELNGIKDDRIGAGQVLKLPTGAAATTVVSLSKVISAAKTDPPKKGTPVSYAGVRVLEDALVAEGLLAPGYADGHFGTATKSAYALYQQRRGYRGRDADGIPGKATLTALGRMHGFTVTT
ncbi:LysM peptidoglycan-binding domain-containing protein [Streptomyces sp. NRRL F-5135]|uniref:LysM peptidoglycan-binding domain-containing protein n=1 Tax=Streptomyces sp. NRRL F-5135 TaxID=1463858 RepID=UPI0004C9A2F9|nr:LysM peptidoglycan-binding domain-containing protein [Streptomyces sp. NRRL F-5135]